MTRKITDDYYPLISKEFCSNIFLCKNLQINSDKKVKSCILIHEKLSRESSPFPAIPERGRKTIPYEAISC